MVEQIISVGFYEPLSGAWVTGKFSRTAKNIVEADMDFGRYMRYFQETYFGAKIERIKIINKNSS